MTTRTLTHPSPGPVAFDANSYAADIRVTVGQVETATVTISTPATTGPAHDAVQDATLTHGHGRLHAEVHDETGGTGGIVVNSNGGVIITGSVGGSTSIINGRVYINGREATPNAATGPQGPVRIEAALPYGSSVDLRTRSGDITTRGTLESAVANTTSGDIEIEHGRAVTARTVSGDVEVQVAGSAQVATTSGDVEIGDVGAVTATTVSGDVKVERTDGRASITTVSGDIKAGYSGLEPSTHTVSGKVRVRQIHAPVQDAPPSPHRPEPEDAVPAGCRPRENRGEPEDAAPSRTVDTPWWRR